jgi:hypothetical protein
MKKEKNDISYEEVMNAIAIIQANIIATRTHETAKYLSIIQKAIQQKTIR